MDLVVFGATGFAGRLVAAHLAEHAPEGVAIGLAGRSRERLEAVRAELGPRAAGWDLVVADADDRPSLDALAARARVVATTVGPYQRHGLDLAGACARAGTHYADLAGEVLFVRASADGWHATAQRSGARIVHACGFDSVPSDLGVLTVHEAARSLGLGGLTDTTLVVRAMRGGISGGSLASALGQLDELRSSPQARAVAADPYALSPDRAAEPDAAESDPSTPRHDPELGTWLAPFVMAPFNTRIVRRSNALTGWAYGRGLHYQEGIATGDGVLGQAKAWGITAAVSALFAGLAFPPSRALLDRVLPGPGEGPSEEQLRRGRLRLEIHAGTESGTRLRGEVAIQGDPGYAETAVMLGQTALCLACDGERLPDRAGVLTPATAMGAALTDRLRRAGHTYEVSP